MSADLHAGLAYSLHAMGDNDLKSENLRELVIDAAMVDEHYGSGLRPVLNHLLLALMELRDVELEDVEDDDDAAEMRKKLDYPENPEQYFFDKYKEVARRNDYAYDSDEIWWPDHWPTVAIWAAHDLDYLATLAVGKDQNQRAAMIAYFKEHHPEMLNPEKKE